MQARKKSSDYFYPTISQLRVLKLIDEPHLPSCLNLTFPMAYTSARACIRKGYADKNGRITELGKRIRERLAP